MQPEVTAIAQAWQDAANRQDIDRLVELSDPQIEIVGPRGSGYGLQLLRDWLGRAGLTLETQRIFARATTVVMAQHAVWRSLETGAVTGEADLASRFRVESGKIVQYARFDTLAAALAETDLRSEDEISLH
jgi:hypothetical protein